MAIGDQVNELLVMVAKLAELTQMMDLRMDELEDRLKTLELGSEV